MKLQFYSTYCFIQGIAFWCRLECFLNKAMLAEKSFEKIGVCTLMSVRLWNFKDGGS